MPSLIEDYALIGDCRSAALVAKNGSIDWLCMPRFDANACFAGLLGTNDNGHWQIVPSEPITSVRRRYRPGTLILETEFTTASGTARLIDFMPPQTQAPDIFRIIEGVEGEVQFRSELRIRYDYGSIRPWIYRVDRGIRATAGPDTIDCWSDVYMQVEDCTVSADFVIGAHQRATFQLTWSPTHAPPPSEKHPDQTLGDAEQWWRDWSDRCQYEGRYRDDVVGSMVVLKALTYRPTGGIVAAPTTSLPEYIGGTRNWDYRYCWLRDATYTLYALLAGGYVDESNAWQQWLVNAAAGDPSQLQIMYGVAGERRLTEFELKWLPGYEDSKPVRIGNAAYSQHQMDVPGAIMDALHFGRKQGLDLTQDSWRVQEAIVEFVASHWRDPDEGIWEIRNKKRHFTHSKVMAWVAADRAVKDVEQFGLPGDVEKWRKLRDDIHREVCAQGFNSEVGAFVQSYGSKEADASLLTLPLVGFIDAKDPRWLGTIEFIEKELVNDGFVHRYRTDTNIDGLPEGEGAFILCSFWLAENYAKSGRTKDARKLFDMLRALRNDVGLLSEEYDVEGKRMVGNFPQAFSHIGLVHTAYTLSNPAIEPFEEYSDDYQPPK